MSTVRDTVKILHDQIKGGELRSHSGLLLPTHAPICVFFNKALTRTIKVAIIAPCLQTATLPLIHFIFGAAFSLGRLPRVEV